MLPISGVHHDLLSFDGWLSLCSPLAVPSFIYSAACFLSFAHVLPFLDCIYSYIYLLICLSVYCLFLHSLSFPFLFTLFLLFSGVGKIVFPAPAGGFLGSEGAWFSFRSVESRFKVDSIGPAKATLESEAASEQRRHWPSQRPQQKLLHFAPVCATLN